MSLDSRGVFLYYIFMINIRKKIEDTLKKLGANIIETKTFNDNSGSDIMFVLNNKQYYIELSKIDNLKELIDKEFIQWLH